MQLLGKHTDESSSCGKTKIRNEDHGKVSLLKKYYNTNWYHRRCVWHVAPLR